MSEMNPTGGGKSPLSLFMGITLIIALAAVAYLAGAGLAKRWLATSLALPLPLPVATPVPAPVSTRISAIWLTPGGPAESTLGADVADHWRFRGVAGQSIIIEMWLHPGSGSSVDTELTVSLLSPDGTVLASEMGSVFLPPYLTWPQLADDLY